MCTRAAVFAEHSKPLVVDEVMLEDPAAGQVLVKLFASGICHSQPHQMHGTTQITPVLLAHEATGVVQATDAKVSHVEEGDRVMITWVQRNPRDSRPLAATADWHGKKVQSQTVWIWAEHVLCDEAFVVPLAGDVPRDITAIIGCAEITGCRAVTNTAKVQAGETVAVFGYGGVGLCILQAAANVGAGMVIAVDLDAEKLEFAKQFGATHFVNAKDTDAAASGQGLSNGGVDYAFDAIGVVQMMTQVAAATRGNRWGVTTGGTVVLVGVPQTPATLDACLMRMGERTFRGSLGGSSAPDRDLPQYVQWHKEGKLPLDKLETRRFTLDTVNDGPTALERGEILGRSIMVYGDAD